MAAALILGAGDGIGGAIARRFAEGGMTAVLVRRDLDKGEAAAEALRQDGFEAVARSADIRDPEAVTALFDEVEASVGPIDVCVYNAGANVNRPLLDLSPKLFRQVWDLACFGGFLAARECARVMTPRGKGSLLFTGATASLKANSGYAAFATAKFGLRAVAQASARELGTKNVHVAHIVIDCGVKSDVTEKFLAAQGFDASDLAEDTMADPASIAEAYWYLHTQPRDAWTHELDLRPFAEEF